MIEFLAPVLGGVLLGVAAFLLREQRKLLRQIRKLASLYPPYVPTTDDEDLGNTSVKIDNDWTDLGPGRD